MPKPSKPRPWWLNTYFLFALAMAAIGIVGLIRGADFIRDPGQPPSTLLPWLYLSAAVLFLINGWISHKQYLEHFEEMQKEEKDA